MSCQARKYRYSASTQRTLQHHIMIDIRTVLILNALVFLIATGFSYYMYTRKVPVDGVKWLIAGFGCGLISMVSFFTRGYIPTVYSVLFGNSLALLFLIIIYNWVRVFLGKEKLTKRQWSFIAAIISASACTYTYYVAIDNNIFIRIFIVNTLVGIIGLLCGYTLVRVKDVTFCKITGISCLLHGSYSIIYGTVSLLSQQSSVEYLQAGPLIRISVLVSLIFGIMLMMGVSSMINERLVQMLEKEARTDPLTGLGNRRALYTAAAHHVARLHRLCEPLVILVMDLDRFKSVNDKFGHPAGDALLRHFAAILQKQFRGTDQLFRFGGEEFVALLQPSDERGAVCLAERLRREVAACPLQLRGASIAVTVSIGIANMLPEEPDITRALGRADQALYKAKAGGRNRVESSYTVHAADCTEPVPAV